MSVTHAPVAVASAPSAASAASAASAVSAKADWDPATAIPPAATVPPVTTRARRRVMLEFLWFPVMARNVGTLPVRTLSGRCAQPEDAEKAEVPGSHRHQRRVLPPLEDLVEAHHGATARFVADLDVVGEFADEAEAAAVLRLHGGRAGRPHGRETRAGVGDLDTALLAVEIG